MTWRCWSCIAAADPNAAPPGDVTSSADAARLDDRISAFRRIFPAREARDLVE
jgi:hypothetical protein